MHFRCIVNVYIHTYIYYICRRDNTLWSSLFRAIIKHPDQKMLETVVHALTNSRFRRIYEWKVSQIPQWP